MTRWFGSLLTGLFLLIAPAAHAANSSVPNMTAAASVGGTDLWYCVQSSGTLDRKCTSAQVAAYIYGLMSGDATASGTGAITFATVNSNVGSFGSATNCATITVNAKGLITAASAATCTPAVGSITGLGTGIATWLATPSSANLLAALTTKTGTGSAVFGTAPTISSLNATTAATLAFITGSTQCLHVNSSGAISGTGSDCGSGSGGVTSIAGNTGAFTLNATTGITNSTNDIQCEQGSASQFGCLKADGTTITASSGVLTAIPGVTSRTVTTSTDTILSTDRGNVVYYNSASSIAITQPAPTGNFAAGFFTVLCNINAGTVTVTPGSGTIYGASTLAIKAGSASAPSCAPYQSDGTNFNALDAQLGAGVPAALGVSLSGAGGLTSTIASGTAALGTSAISSGTCATAVTVTAANVATTDIVTAGFAADPTATTGFAPTAMLTIVPYPTSGNVNFKVCNLTGSSITPSAVTINWRVTR